VPVGGVPVLERAVRWVADLGVDRIWINVHEGADADTRHASGAGCGSADIRYSHEPELLGTAGAWKLLEREWTTTSLVVYGDNLMHFDLHAFARAHRRAGRWRRPWRCSIPCAIPTHPRPEGGRWIDDAVVRRISSRAATRTLPGLASMRASTSSSPT
jgi:hypothetical protein